MFSIESQVRTKNLLALNYGEFELSRWLSEAALAEAIINFMPISGPYALERNSLIASDFMMLQILLFANFVVV